MTLKDDPLVLLGWSCPYCGAPTKLVDDSEIYGRSYGSKCYVCKPCDAWVGCHKGTDTSLGRIAGKELRQLKHLAYESFDRIWKEGHTSRKGAYEILSTALGLPIEQTHIGMFDEDMCRKVISLSNTVLKYIKSDG
ncbi:zinc-finger-containing protein [uncultured Duncaniella sp.]|uniref:zinc-finger-containing protein n=1 Tax=uncultured Duncaniella sp. TaxID=2768039 RepID=UPI002729FF79|nr:zinc-finger-containing protein [uncultured Duncaniella sp.]